MTFQLVLGTNNAKKLREMKLLLSSVDVQLKSLAEIENSIEVDETGTSFQENAELKAAKQAKHLGQWVLGEDSGLSVKALDGEPGIYSARFSGPDATDEKNNDCAAGAFARRSGGEADRLVYPSAHGLIDPDGVKSTLVFKAGCFGRYIGVAILAMGIWLRSDGLSWFEYHQTFAQLGAMP
ncbi:UNVERIFIED_CONTAM: hypothetical protein GTU68_006725 [Idotea baltica]|nr:hypothetical protein [Idotea baltica]